MRRHSMIVCLLAGLSALSFAPAEAVAKTSLRISNCSQQTLLLCAYNSSDSSQLVATTSVVLNDDSYVSDLYCDSGNGCQLRIYKGGGVCEQRRASDQSYIVPGTPVLQAGTYTLVTDRGSVKVQESSGTSCGRPLSTQAVPVLNCSGQTVVLCTSTEKGNGRTMTSAPSREVTNLTCIDGYGDCLAAAYKSFDACMSARPKSDPSALAQPVSVDPKAAYVLRWSDEKKSFAILRAADSADAFRDSENRKCKGSLPVGSDCSSASECQLPFCRAGKCGLPPTGPGPARLPSR